MAPPSSNASRPGRALAVLAALIVVLLLAILGSDMASPGSWSKNFRVHLGLDLTSGTTVELRAVKPGGRTPTACSVAHPQIWANCQPARRGAMGELH